MTDSRSDSVTFASLGLKPEVMEGIREAGFVTCTPIQAQTLPIALAGRDVAGQIHRDALVLGAHTGFRHLVVFGGIDYEKQRQQLLDGCDVLIGTPGRLIDYYKQHVFDLKSAQVLVLDEADRMFDLGFIADIRYILRRLPPPGRRQSML